MKIRFKWITAVIVCVCLLAGCGGGKSKQEKLKEEQQEEFIDTLPRTDSLDVLWDKNLGDFNQVGFNFVIDQGVSYSIDAKGRLMAVDISNGDVIWKNKYKHDITAGIGVGADVLVAVDEKSRLVAFNRSDGERLWRTPIKAEVLIPPVVTADNVVVKTLDAKLIGFDLLSGDLVWTYRHEKPGLSLRGGSAPLVARNFLFTGFEDGRLVAVDALTGKLLWDVPVGRSSGRDEIQRLTDIDAQPILDGNELYVGAFQRRIMALDVAGGNILWSRPISTYQNFSLDRQALYVIEDTNNVMALNRQSGNLAWLQDGLNGINLTSISVFGKALLLTDDDKSVFLLNRSDGEILSHEKLSGGQPLQQPLVVGDTAYILMSNGKLKAIALSQ